MRIIWFWNIIVFFWLKFIELFEKCLKNKNEEVYLVCEPLEIYKICIKFLENYINESDKIASKL